MPYANPPWSEITTTTRENRSAEHGSLFSKTPPDKVGKPAPKHPLLKPKWNGKYPIRKSSKRK